MVLRSLLLIVVLSCLPTSALGVADEAPQHIVFILADDLGWRDPGFMGSDYHRTPHLDRLAAGGMTFTNAYANAANCAPSRASLMSGLYAPRTGVYTVGSSSRGRTVNRPIIPVKNTTTLAGSFVTLAESLKEAGYATAFIGKWHLGADDETGPLAQGFDVNIAGNTAGHPRSYFSPYRNPDLTDGPEGEHLTARLTDEAIQLVQEHRDEQLFLFLSYYAVHTPIQPSPASLARAQDRPRGTLHHRANYAALLEDLDDGVGRLLDAMNLLGLADDTLVVFMSDNGGVGAYTSMMPLRGAKGMFYEGGIRVPLVLRWPATIAPASRSAEPVIGLDLYPTLIELGGGTRPDHQACDGVSMAPILRGEATTLAPRALFWHFPAYLQGRDSLGQGPWRTTPCGVIRRGDEKLIEYFEDGRLELYDLATDPGEATDLATRRPARVEALHAELKAWRTRVNAPVPAEANPDYVPSDAADSSEAAADDRSEGSRQADGDGEAKTSNVVSRRSRSAASLSRTSLSCSGQFVPTPQMPPPNGQLASLDSRSKTRTTS